ncbi:hypothetical protein [Cellulomonas sp. PhB143]|uniref:hypothetical protein n=1 Tax=Cellulomonas sp. PhB143 TaxID=2485186 RepID=UPI000F4AA029|nr:hypothetical protein [Cellulomonas sp. PhB143]ROS78455.1 hypothetical protein EDF32_0351 [Cellulomonas sp. PhB143]
MHRKSLSVVLASGLAVAALAGCSSSDDDASSDASSSAAAPSSPAVVKNTEYRSIDDFKDAVVAAGLTCDDWTTTDATEPAWQTGTCDGDVTLTLYASQENKDADAATARKDSSVAVLVGPNWTVVGSADDVDAVAPKLGGSTEPTAAATPAS